MLDDLKRALSVEIYDEIVVSGDVVRLRFLTDRNYSSVYVFDEKLVLVENEFGRDIKATKYDPDEIGDLAFKLEQTHGHDRRQ